MPTDNLESAEYLTANFILFYLIQCELKIFLSDEYKLQITIFENAQKIIICCFLLYHFYSCKFAIKMEIMKHEPVRT